MLKPRVKEFLDYYENLLIIQYHERPKARATIRALLRPLAELFDVIKELENAFNIEMARGVQLDIVANQGQYY